MGRGSLGALRGRWNDGGEPEGARGGGGSEDRGGRGGAVAPEREDDDERRPRREQAPGGGRGGGERPSLRGFEEHRELVRPPRGLPRVGIRFGRRRRRRQGEAGGEEATGLAAFFAAAAVVVIVVDFGVVPVFVVKAPAAAPVPRRRRFRLRRGLWPRGQAGVVYDAQQALRRRIRSGRDDPGPKDQELSGKRRRRSHRRQRRRRCRRRTNPRHLRQHLARALRRQRHAHRSRPSGPSHELDDPEADLGSWGSVEDVAAGCLGSGTRRRRRSRGRIGRDKGLGEGLGRARRDEIGERRRRLREFGREKPRRRVGAPLVLPLLLPLLLLLLRVTMILSQ